MERSSAPAILPPHLLRLLVLLIVRWSAALPPVASALRAVAKDGGTPCTMCASCDNPCQQIYYPSPPPPQPPEIPQCPPPPSAPGSTFYYYSPPPPSSGGGGGGYSYPPPNPFLPYFPFYYSSLPPPSHYDFSSAAVSPKSFALFFSAYLFLFLVRIW
ncbi:uncharacterized protein LOC141844596 [Curcuma longa]|uniref:uncharacterized protein LOC141844596 n=1 Tax=Curcuma longa TaxID=136217 RepID=UPI003D9EE830